MLGGSYYVCRGSYHVCWGGGVISCIKGGGGISCMLEVISCK